VTVTKATVRLEKGGLWQGLFSVPIAALAPGLGEVRVERLDLGNQELKGKRNKTKQELYEPC
jgi:hypothetical protein